MMRAVLMVAALMLALAGCQGDEADPMPTGLPNYDPNLIETQRAACEARGGQFGRAGLAGGHACFEIPRDAGKMCSRASDCESACLARSQTCAPVKPLFGCVEVLTQSGRPATLCVD